MKAIQRTAYGNVEDVLVLADVDVPTLKDDSKGEVVIKVHAVAIAPSDVMLAEGWLTLIIKEGSPPFRSGKHFAGVVIETSSPMFEVNDRVFGELDGSGTLAEFVTCKDGTMEKIPNEIASFVDATALCEGQYGLVALRDMCQVGTTGRRRVLILGGSSGTGSMAIQIAKCLGATFVATTSTNRDLCISLGADHVYDYRTENWWEDPQRNFDVIFDCVGGSDGWKHCVNTMPKRTVFVTLVPDGPSRPPTVKSMLGLACSMMNRSFWSWFGYHQYKFVVGSPDASLLSFIATNASNGGLHSVIDSVHEFTLEGVVDAFTIQKSHRARGKVVIQICE